MRDRVIPRPSGWYWRVILGCSALLSLAAWKHVTAHPAQRFYSEPRDNTRADTTAGADTASVDTVHSAAVNAFAQALWYNVWDGGMLTDELRAPLNGLHVVPPHLVNGGDWMFMSHDIWRRISLKDVRTIPERRDTTPHTGMGGGKVDHTREGDLDEGYQEMQGARAYLSTALGRLANAARSTVNPEVVQAYRGELYALEGYAEIQLADLFCSGVPLNTFAEIPIPWPDTRKAAYNDYVIQDWGQDRLLAYPDMIAKHQVMYHPSSTTVQVYQAALAKFDTALSLARGNAHVLDLARVGKGRVWLALGQYDSAAAAVASVSQGFVYKLSRDNATVDPDGNEVEATVADREGHNGLPYLSSGDPRTVTTPSRTDKLLGEVRFPPWFVDLDGCKSQPTTMYGATVICVWGTATFTLASWEEAVLIQAEATLHTNAADGKWLQLLNQLRATASIPGTTRPDPAKLPPLKDPGTEHGRIALLFAERGYWLFLTGKRQGDLRRLVRNYHWPEDQVYPTGPYVLPDTFAGAPLMPPVGHYGTDVTIPIPPLERENPYFHGCLDREP